MSNKNKKDDATAHEVVEKPSLYDTDLAEKLPWGEYEQRPPAYRAFVYEGREACPVALPEVPDYIRNECGLTRKEQKECAFLEHSHPGGLVRPGYVIRIHPKSNTVSVETGEKFHANFRAVPVVQEEVEDLEEETDNGKGGEE